MTVPTCRPSRTLSPIWNFHPFLFITDIAGPNQFGGWPTRRGHAKTVGSALVAFEDAVVELREESGVAGVVDRHVDDGDLAVAQRLFECVLELVDAVDADPVGAEGSGVLRDVVVAQLHARRAAVLKALLEGDHVVGVVAHDHVGEAQAKTGCGFQFL